MQTRRLLSQSLQAFIMHKCGIIAVFHLVLLCLATASLSCQTSTALFVSAHDSSARKSHSLCTSLQTSFSVLSTASVDRNNYRYGSTLAHQESSNTIPATITTLASSSGSDQLRREDDPEECQPQNTFHRDYQLRKEKWAKRYTSLQSLRDTFGANKNKLWGDLDAASARRLYKTLLPKALLDLVQAGVQPEDLAPLAYQARVAAKLYARERCRVPSRIMAALFDGFRTLKRYGKFQPVGMSYNQVWAKYEAQVLEDLEDTAAEDHQELIDANVAVRKICLRILESSCRTNSNVDKWVLPTDPSEQKDSEELLKIAQTLENDVRKLLDPLSDESNQKPSPLEKLRSLWRWLIQKRVNINEATSHR